MEVIGKKKYNEWKKAQKDPYGKEIFNYAERWANIMEEKMARGHKLEDIAIQSDREANTTGITGFMYGSAVQVLSSHWKYGEQLRIWHNIKTQIYNEGEIANKNRKVLNPALLSISTK